MQKENKHIFAAVLFLLALLAAYAVLFLMTNRKISETSVLLSEEKAFALGDERARSLERAISETSRSRELAASYFIRQNEAVAFIEKMENFGTRARISLSLGNAAVSPDGALFRLNIRTKGSFEDTMYFWALLENLPHKISLERADFRTEKSEASAAESVWTGDFTLAVESFLADVQKKKE